MLLFGAETWVVSPMMEWALIAFIHGAARRLTGRQPRRGRDGKWHYPLKNLPDTRFVAPSLLRIPCSPPQIFWAFAKFPATAGQSSSPSVKILSRYLNLGTDCICFH